MSESLQIKREGRVMHLAMNRPERRNALNVELCSAIASALGQAESDTSVGAILLSGNGKSFCSGMDLDEALTREAGRMNEIHERIFTAGTNLSKPMVAAVHGAALAGGTGLVANCHIVIASEDATFGLTEIRIGLWPFVVFRSMAAAIGERRATEMALSGRIFGADEARQYGLVHQVVDSGSLMPQASQIAATVAQWSPTAVHTGLAFIRESRGLPWGRAGLLARRMRESVLSAPDFAEGVRAFREKRPPKWPSLSKP
jgi:enoyl-CoA hydratase/carnithine racemase